MADTNLMDLLQSHIEKKSELSWTGTLKEYVQMVVENPGYIKMLIKEF